MLGDDLKRKAVVVDLRRKAMAVIQRRIVVVVYVQRKDVEVREPLSLHIFDHRPPWVINMVTRSRSQLGPSSHPGCLRSYRLLARQMLRSETRRHNEPWLRLADEHNISERETWKIRDRKGQ